EGLPDYAGISTGIVECHPGIASLLGRPTAYRAVAQACASNVLCIVIPCHRVVASDGTLGGFGGGLAVKRQLLKLEGALDAVM
ncbi:unnamed protein product, partial [Heligmosomoides polygyrus]|uniref:Methylated-DNA--protein-cysteine methyltransferase n=1 Tax=Heligmosomoides polygyrus TaxID=6339 RepID=A0A183GUT4_HELPZ